MKFSVASEPGCRYNDPNKFHLTTARRTPRLAGSQWRILLLMMFVLINLHRILAIILVLVLVAVQNENSVFGHAQGQNFTSALQVRAA